MQDWVSMSEMLGSEAGTRLEAGQRHLRQRFGARGPTQEQKYRSQAKKSTTGALRILL